MTKKEIIAQLRAVGYKANYKNVLVGPLEKFGYVIVIQNGMICKVFI